MNKKRLAVGVVPDGQERDVAGKPQILSEAPLLNLPLGSFSEAAAIEGVNRARIREIIASLNRQVRWGKLQRIVVNGMPYYCPTKSEYGQQDGRGELVDTTGIAQEHDRTAATRGEWE